MRETLSYLYHRAWKIFKTAYAYNTSLARSLAFLWLHFRIRKHTHTSIIDLLHLQNFIKDLDNRQVKGDIVECGSWKGGSAALLHHSAQKLRWNNNMYVYDSFEGFPEPDVEGVDGAKAQGIMDGKFDWIKAKEEDVLTIFKKMKIFDASKVTIVKGWFNETTPSSPVKEIALLHCDGDLYESTKSTLDSFYHKVLPGGYVVSNDYGDIWIGAKKAMDECISENCPQVKITKIDGGGAYFIKPA